MLPHKKKKNIKGIFVLEVLQRKQAWEQTSAMQNFLFPKTLMYHLLSIKNKTKQKETKT